MQTEQEIICYLEECQKKDGCFPKFCGYFPFEVLLKENLITPHITMIGILYPTSEEVRYFVDEGGMFYLEDDFDNSYDPKKILSETNSPAGWKPLLLRRSGLKMNPKNKEGGK